MSWCKDISYMFANCKKLKYLNINNFETKLIRDMSNLFSNCSSLESVDLSSFDTSALTKMDYMFSHSGLKNLNLTTFNTLRVKTFTEVFEECHGLNLILVENNCKNLLETIPDYVNVTRI